MSYTKTYLRCNVCGDEVEGNNCRAHLAEHHSGAWALDLDDVMNQYQEPQP